jgi:hypothetical protein
MEEFNRDGLKTIRHLAGIVPVAAPPLEFNMPWHDSMMPISPNYLAVERAVYECLMAGCSTIWIVCHLGMQPLLRKRIGDYIWLGERLASTDVLKRRKYSSIFYVAIHPKDREKRDSLGWSALYGADKAYRVCSYLSRWVAPDKYYCAFPYGIAPEDYIRKNHFRLLRSTKKCVFRYNGKTIKDGIHTSFTFNAKDFIACRDYIKAYAKKTWEEEYVRTVGDHSIIKRLRLLSLDQVYAEYSLDDAEIIDLPWFYDISTWEGYREFIASGRNIQSQREIFFTDKERMNDPGRGRRADSLESEDYEEGERTFDGDS